MNKRVLALTLALSMVQSLAVRAEIADVPYSPQAADTALAKGCAVLLEFSASW